MSDQDEVAAMATAGENGVDGAASPGAPEAAASPAPAGDEAMPDAAEDNGVVEAAPAEGEEAMLADGYEADEAPDEAADEPPDEAADEALDEAADEAPDEAADEAAAAEAPPEDDPALGEADAGADEAAVDDAGMEDAALTPEDAALPPETPATPLDGGEVLAGADGSASPEAPLEGDEPPAEEPPLEGDEPAPEASPEPEDEEMVPMEPEDEDGLPAEPLEEPAEEPEEPKEELAEEEALDEHLKQAVEGSLRLKRMLSSETLPAAKKRKIGSMVEPEIVEKANALKKKWGLMEDVVVSHVLLGATVEELDYLANTNYSPSKFDNKRGPGELTDLHMVKYRESKLVGGSKVDVLAAFKFRWGLDAKSEKLLKDLPHKDLRLVLDSYDGTRPLEEVVEEAAAHIPHEDAGAYAMTTLPGGPGMHTVSRFNRMELIDPFGHSAVFGDANLTFSLNLVKHRHGLGHVGRVIATTFEELHTLRERYQEIDQSIKTLEDHDSEVYHGVDCTRIAVDPRFQPMVASFGAVYYNFPHSGVIPGFFDSHPLVNWRHENLMRMFFRALRTFVKPGGQVKVASNSGATGVRFSYIVGSAVENEFEHVETMPFLEWMLHRYGRSYGDRRDKNRRPDAKNNQSYNAQNANSDMVYCFRYAPSGKALAPQRLRMPPSLETLQKCWEGPFATSTPHQKARLARQLHDRFLKEVSGTHVG